MPQPQVEYVSDAGMIIRCASEVMLDGPRGEGGYARGRKDVFPSRSDLRQKVQKRPGAESREKTWSRRRRTDLGQKVKRPEAEGGEEAEVTR